MRILVKFPTRGRADNFFYALDKYYELAHDIDRMEFHITIDQDDDSMMAPDVLKRLAGYTNLFVSWGRSMSKIHAINRDLKSNGWEIVLLASDDMIPVAPGYDEIIREKMRTHHPDTDGVLWFNDGNRSDLNTLTIMGKKYYDRFGYLYHPGYRSLYCDKEFTLVGERLGRQTYFDQVIIRHEHPDYGYGDKDQVHDLNKINKNRDLRLFLKREASNFGLGFPVRNYLAGIGWEIRHNLRLIFRNT